MRLVIAGARPWNRRSFESWPGAARHETIFIRAPDELVPDRLASFAPDYVFFVHWSWRIPAAVYERFECIGFHMTDLPFGRGGSPLQNLIVRGVRQTRLSAFRIASEMDAGAIYSKRPLRLDGSAQQIFQRASDLAFEMVDDILERRPVPVPQQGDVVLFDRRTPAESRIEGASSLDELYDFIRMLDAEGYPPAFLDLGEFRVELTNAAREGDALTARARIVRIADGKES